MAGMTPQRFATADAWIKRVQDDPYRPEMRRLPDMRHDEAGDMYFGHVPGTKHADRSWITCSYWINEYMRTVKCDQFSILTEPIHGG